jgi:hypothetical protein
MKPMQIIALLTALVSARMPAAQAGPPVPVLFDVYKGSAHHNSKSPQENVDFTLDVDDFNGDNFTAHLNSIPIQAKLTQDGRITFSGQARVGNQVIKIKNGKALLSAGKAFMNGSFKIEGNLQPQANGSYTFSTASPNAFAGLRPGSAVHSQSNIQNLGGHYEGQSHHRTNVGLEGENIEISVSDANLRTGKFTGIFRIEGADVPIHGKVDSKGKVTFSGNLTAMNFTLGIDHGAAQLSATGTFLLGTCHFAGTGVLSGFTGGAIFETGAN